MGWGILLISLIITAVAYLFVPVIVVLVKGKLDKDSARVWAIANAVIVMILFYFFEYSLDETTKFNVLPALFWGSIGYNLLVDRDKEDNGNKSKKSYVYNENMTEKEKYNFLLNMLKREMGAKDIYDATLKLYSFYEQKGVSIPSSLLVEQKEANENRKYEILVEVLKSGMKTNGLDDTIIKLKEFYENR